MEALDQLNFARIYTLGRIKQSDETKWDYQPKGFHNTIRWNVGHIYIQMELLTQKAIPTYDLVYPEWVSFFIPGTSPEQWVTNPPSTQQLIHALEEQAPRIISLLKEKLSGYLPEVIQIGTLHTMETVDALVQFMVWHEGVHAGIIHSLNLASE